MTSILDINLDDGYAPHAGYLHAAFPCGCQDEGCQGWQMRHLRYPAPPKEVGHE
jgi:hypothetical protein